MTADKKHLQMCCLSSKIELDGFNCWRVNMVLILAVLALVILLVNLRKNDFDSVFVSLSVFYMMVFYIYPLYILGSGAGATYLGSTVDVNGGVKASFSLLVFIAGFLSLGFVKFLVGGRKPLASEVENAVDYGGTPSRSVTVLFWVALSVVSAYLLMGVLDSGRAERGYLIRQGVEKGSWLKFLSSIVLGALSIGVFFVAAASKKNKVVLLISALMVLSLFTGATSRASMLVFLAVLFVYYFKVKLNYFVLSLFLIFPLVVPILVNMKEIISGVVLNHEVPDILSFYRSGVTQDIILANFGHPVVSMLFVDRLIELVGYRYFYDYLQGFLFYLRVFGVDFGDSLTYYNTEVFLGSRMSIIPTGYVAFGFVQLSYLGVFFSGIFYRLIGAFSGFVFRLYGSNNTDAVKFYFANAAAYTFYVGEVRTMVIIFLIPMLVVYFSSRLMLRK